VGVIVYEVNLAIDGDIADAYRAWLEAHVAQILALPGFTGARILDVLEPASQPREVALSVQYTLRDRASLDAYLRDHAPRMRGDGEARFGGRFRASRRTLGVVREFRG
jgi:hypothetical protein